MTPRRANTTRDRSTGFSVPCRNVDGQARKNGRAPYKIGSVGVSVTVISSRGRVAAYSKYAGKLTPALQAAVYLLRTVEPNVARRYCYTMTVLINLR
jgi:hypothetical protein